MRPIEIEYLCFCWNQYLFYLLIHTLTGAALDFSGALGSGALVEKFYM
jgi:hypothetical protein